MIHEHKVGKPRQCWLCGPLATIDQRPEGIVMTRKQQQLMRRWEPVAAFAFKQLDQANRQRLLRLVARQMQDDWRAGARTSKTTGP